MTQLRIEQCSYQLAKFACENFHYSKKIPASVCYKYAAYENDVFIGVVLFGYGSNPRIASTFNLANGKVLELVRVALDVHKTPTSSVVSKCVKELKKDNPLVEILVSFADFSQGHVGTIYQAMNWYYVSKVKRAVSKIICGEEIHNRSIYARYGTHDLRWLQENIDPEAKLTPHVVRHKYAMPLKKKHRKTLEAMHRPYPKLAIVAHDG